MKNTFLAVCLFLFCSCSQAYVTQAHFSEIPVGANITEVETKIGKAYKVRETSNGMEHLYIERIPLSKDHIVQKHYTIIYSNGIVIKKIAKEIEEPGIKAGFY